jgi:hypothetical protein
MSTEKIIYTCVEPIWLRYAGVLLERRQRSEVDCPPAQLIRRVLENEYNQRHRKTGNIAWPYFVCISHYFVGIRCIKHRHEDAICQSTQSATWPVAELATEPYLDWSARICYRENISYIRVYTLLPYQNLVLIR